MKKSQKIGRLEQEFVYKQGMAERLIEAYKITVKQPQAIRENHDLQRTEREQKTCSHLRESILIQAE
jgi:hypothetical protein